MQIDKLDVENCEKLLTLMLKRARIKNPTGEECLAIHDLIHWGVRLKKRMSESLATPPPQAPIAPVVKKK